MLRNNNKSSSLTPQTSVLFGVHVYSNYSWNGNLSDDTVTRQMLQSMLCLKLWSGSVLVHVKHFCSGMSCTTATCASGPAGWAAIALATLSARVW